MPSSPGAAASPAALAAADDDDDDDMAEGRLPSFQINALRRLLSHASFDLIHGK